MLKHNKKGVNFPKIKKIYGCSVHGTWVKIRSIRAILRKKLEEYNKNILFSIKFSLLSQRNFFLGQFILTTIAHIRMMLNARIANQVGDRCLLLKQWIKYCVVGIVNYMYSERKLQRK